jgi:hypothetical protein
MLLSTAETTGGPMQTVANLGSTPLAMVSEVEIETMRKQLFWMWQKQTQRRHQCRGCGITMLRRIGDSVIKFTLIHIVRASRNAQAGFTVI